MTASSLGKLNSLFWVNKMQSTTPWKFPRQCKSRAKKLVEQLEDYDIFEKFLRKVDATSEGQLIRELFGTTEAYIDTPGYYAKDPELHEHSIIYCIASNSPNGDLRVLELFVWFANNFDKALEWLEGRKNATARTKT